MARFYLIFINLTFCYSTRARVRVAAAQNWTKLVSTAFLNALHKLRLVWVVREGGLSGCLSGDCRVPTKYRFTFIFLHLTDNRQKFSAELLLLQQRMQRIFLIEKSPPCKINEKWAKRISIVKNLCEVCKGNSLYEYKILRNALTDYRSLCMQRFINMCKKRKLRRKPTMQQ